jgi:hypothetical protein
VGKPVVVRADLETALDAVATDFAPDELAFLAITGGCERQVCDRLAWSLVRHGHCAMREWRLVDLAVLDSDWVPLALLEAKACDTVDVKWDGGPKRQERRDRWRASTYLEALIWSDVTKMTKLAPNAARYALMVVVHVLNPDALVGPLVGKYGRGRLKGTEAEREGQERIVREYLLRLGGEVTKHALGNGQYQDVRVGVGAYLAGPLTLIPAPVDERAVPSAASEAAQIANDGTRTIAERRDALLRLGEERPDLEEEAARYLETLAMLEDAQ